MIFIYSYLYDVWKKKDDFEPTLKLSVYYVTYMLKIVSLLWLFMFSSRYSVVPY